MHFAFLSSCLPVVLPSCLPSFSPSFLRSFALFSRPLLFHPSFLSCFFSLLISCFLPSSHRHFFAFCASHFPTNRRNECDSTQAVADHNRSPFFPFFRQSLHCCFVLPFSLSSFFFLPFLLPLFLPSFTFPYSSLNR